LSRLCIDSESCEGTPAGRFMTPPNKQAIMMPRRAPVNAES
jgi:hypothetical protein